MVADGLAADLDEFMTRYVLEIQDHVKRAQLTKTPCFPNTPVIDHLLLTSSIQSPSLVLVCL